MSNSRLFTFAAGSGGPWKITDVLPIRGETLRHEPTLRILPGSPGGNGGWALRGIRSNERYTTRQEKVSLAKRAAELGRAEADFAVLIPIQKSAAWWALTQEERREIFEEQSHHTKIGLDFLPAVARRLYHCRDLSEAEPFDFLTWFEFAHDELPRFEELLGRLRASAEWRYVTREVEVRLVRS